jgi:2-amino-4-hydroxy-6-hydroxymethyldihydropteridine diphosphokinase
VVQAVIAVGGNVGDVRQALHQAQRLIEQHDEVSQLRTAGVYRSVAMGADAGDSFLNSAWVLETSLEPLDLLDLLQSVENTLGRTRGVRWGPRTLDLDLIFYGDRTIDCPRLTVPHPHCWYRQFVLAPVASLLPKFSHPIFRLTTRQLLERISGCAFLIGYAGDLTDGRFLTEIVSEFPRVKLRRFMETGDSARPEVSLAFWFGSGDSKPDGPFWLHVPAHDGPQFVRDVLTAACGGVEVC